MRGTLGLFNLLELLQLLNHNQRTGALVVQHPTYGETRIYFNKGRIVHATQKNAADEGVLYNLILDEQGSFEFQAGRSAPKETLSQNFDVLMFEVLRMLPQEHFGTKAPWLPQQKQRDHIRGKFQLKVLRDLKGRSVALEKGLLERWEVQLDATVHRVTLKTEDGQEWTLPVFGTDLNEARVIWISSEALMFHNLHAGQTLVITPALQS